MFAYISLNAIWAAVDSPEVESGIIVSKKYGGGKDPQTLGRRQRTVLCDF